MGKMKIVWLGFHQEGVLAFKFLAQAGRLSACLTLDKAERNKRSGAARFDLLADEYGVPCYEIKNINNDASIEIIEQLAPDLLLVIGWSQILNERLINIPSIGCIGAHASLLPRYRGSAPINWAIINGLKQTGNTLIWLRTGVDTGEILEQRSFPITRQDTCASLYKKVEKSNLEMISCAINRIETDGWYGIAQPDVEQPPLPRRKPEDGLIDFSLPSEDIYNLVRALSKPYPGAFSFFLDRKVVFWEGAVVLEKKLHIDEQMHGYVVDHVYSPRKTTNGILIMCGKGYLLVNSVQTDNKILRDQDLLDFFPIGSRFK